MFTMSTPLRGSGWTAGRARGLGGGQRKMRVTICAVQN